MAMNIQKMLKQAQKLRDEEDARREAAQKKKWPYHYDDLVPSEIMLSSVALVLLDLAGKLCDDVDATDACGDWEVDQDGRSYFEDEMVSVDPRVALLVNCSNLIKRGKLRKPRK